MSNTQTIVKPVDSENEFNFPLHKCIHELFEEQVVRSPDAIAVADENERWTYAQLNREANRIGNFLRGFDIGPEKLVAICTERTPRMLACLLGILKAGGAYVPLDPTHPVERLKLILEDSGAAVLLTEKNFAATLPRTCAQTVNLDSDSDKTQNVSDRDLQGEISSDNLCYVIYTSGSTGKPKGVEMPHRCVVNFLFALQHELRLTASDVVLGLTTLSFDISGLELFLPLIIGAQVYLTDSRNAADPEGLARIISKAGATLVQTVPTVWRALIDSGWNGSRNLKIICGGEALPRKLANDLVKRGEVWNAYGPTETAIWSLLCKVNASDKPITIGKPIANTTVYVLDENRRELPVGEIGELCIGGAGVARGYRNRSELTVEKFIANPTNPPERIYRTGDVARFLPDGELEFLGRADFQVKVRGHRIELGEIETALCAHPAIKEAVVVAAKDQLEQAILAAYIKPVSLENVPRPDTLRQFLKERLPDYMLPSVIMTLEKFPTTANGKIDRKALPKPEVVQTKPATAFVAPRTSDEEKLAGIWREVLGLENIGIRDNFFDLGGHSLLLAQIIARVRKNFQVELPLRNFFEAPTIAGLAKILSNQSVVTEYNPISKNDSGISGEELMAKLVELSNEEVEALLNQVLAAQPVNS